MASLLDHWIESLSFAEVDPGMPTRATTTWPKAVIGRSGAERRLRVRSCTSFIPAIVARRLRLLTTARKPTAADRTSTQTNRASAGLARHPVQQIGQRACATVNESRMIWVFSYTRLVSAGGPLGRVFKPTRNGQ